VRNVNFVRFYVSTGGVCPNPSLSAKILNTATTVGNTASARVDRMLSAWLIRRFIDPKARFSFAVDRAAVPGDALLFDMFGVEFIHHGDDCTFETLCRKFKLRDPAVTRVGELVHDIDLKDAKFGAPEASTISSMIDGPPSDPR